MTDKGVFDTPPCNLQPVHDCYGVTRSTQKDWIALYCYRTATFTSGQKHFCVYARSWADGIDYWGYSGFSHSSWEMHCTTWSPDTAIVSGEERTNVSSQHRNWWIAS